MAISIEKAVRRFGGAAAVDGVSAEIADGEFFVVLGPSGCGKSTLLRLIAGLEALDQGVIRLDGAVASGPGVHVAPETRRVGVVFQSYALWPHMTVRGNVAFPIETEGVARAEAAKQALGHLRAVGLEPLAERKPAALSGGQRQRVALARCLASRARAVLMDEPLANLDPHLRAAMEDELAAFHRRSGAATLYITHDQREAMALADTVAVMRAGRFEQVGSPDDIYAKPATEHVARFIGRASLNPADVLGRGGGRLNVRMAGAAAEIGAPDVDAREGATVRVVTRPEDVEIVGEDARGASILAARIISASYRGGRWEGMASAPGAAEPFPLESRSRLDVGEPVRLRLTGGWALGD